MALHSSAAAQNLENTLTTIEEREVDFQKALNDDAAAEHIYKVEKAKSYLRSDGTEKAREAQSVVDSEKLFLDHLQKKAVKEFTREKLKDAQNALDARRSLLSYDTKTQFGYTNQT